MKNILTLLVMALIITGCDVLYGVKRDAPLQSLPKLDCVQGVIERTLGIESVKYRKDEAGTALTISGLKTPASTSYSYVYKGAEGSHIIGDLQVLERYDGTITISQNLRDLNRKPPQEDIDATRPVMILIEQRLEAECGVTNLAGNIKEYCKGVECPSIMPPNKAPN
jgi:hypothetical protein